MTPSTYTVDSPADGASLPTASFHLLYRLHAENDGVASDAEHPSDCLANAWVCLDGTDIAYWRVTDLKVPQRLIQRTLTERTGAAVLEQEHGMFVLFTEGRFEIDRAR